MIRRLIHNLFQTLRKDDGAHFTYNLGVSFVRVGCGILCAAALVFGISFLHIGEHLYYAGEIKARITSMEVRNPNKRTYIGDLFPKYYYYVRFGPVTAGGGAPEESDKYSLLYYQPATPEEKFLIAGFGEYVTKDMYSHYVNISDLPEITLKCYFDSSDRDSWSYLSQSDLKKAEREYREAYPTFDLKTVSFWLLVIALPVLIIGLGEERIAMKYPRTDVTIGDTSIVLSAEETDDLLGEFEREYSKYHRNWVEDPPERTLPRTDLPRNDLFTISDKK